jgi:hypothetical protein
MKFLKEVFKVPKPNYIWYGLNENSSDDELLKKVSEGYDRILCNTIIDINGFTLCHLRSTRNLFDIYIKQLSIYEETLVYLIKYGKIKPDGTIFGLRIRSLDLSKKIGVYIEFMREVLILKTRAEFLNTALEYGQFGAKQLAGYIMIKEK